MTGARADTVYEDAAATVERSLDDEVLLIVCRSVGRVSAQKAICRAFIQVAGNALARLTDDDEAERFHRERATFYRERARRRMPIGGRR